MCGLLALRANFGVCSLGVPRLLPSVFSKALFYSLFLLQERFNSLLRENEFLFLFFVLVFGTWAW